MNDLDEDVSLDIDPTALFVDEIRLTANPSNMLSFYVDWETNRPATTELHVDCSDAFEQTFTSDERRTGHHVFVMGLVDGTICDVEARSVELDGIEEVQTALYEPFELPMSLPELTIGRVDEERLHPGWTVLDLFFPDGIHDAILAVVDEQGRYRWYNQRQGKNHDIHPIDGGFLASSFTGYRSLQLAWDGTEVYRFPFAGHHDIRPSPFNDDHVLYLGNTRENCPEGHRETTVAEFDLASWQTVWVWNVCDHYSPSRVYPNWSHINTVEPVPGERAMIISPRDQSRLFKIDRDTNEIIWTLGTGGDFAMTREDFFIFQHAPELQPNGNILLFDNGFVGIREYSRALELELTFDEDGEPESADAVWQYGDESLFARAKGDADRLPNGNTLITFSVATAQAQSVLLEVTEEGDEVWELLTPSEWSIYRSHRIEPRYGEVR